MTESVYFHKGMLNGVRREFTADGKMAAGYPIYTVNYAEITVNTELTEEAYREAAKTDPVLAISLDDDGREFARRVVAEHAGMK